MLTPNFSCTPPSSRDRSAAARADLTTYGMVGSMSGHMTQGCRRERERGEKQGGGGGGGMSEGAMKTCMGPKWQFEELSPYRLQDMQKIHRARREGGKG